MLAGHDHGGVQTSYSSVQAALFDCRGFCLWGCRLRAYCHTSRKLLSVLGLSSFVSAQHVKPQTAAWSNAWRMRCAGTCSI